MRNENSPPRQPSAEKVARFRGRVLEWWQVHGRHFFPWRRCSATTYEKILAEVLLQRTRAETVSLFFDSFLRRFPSWTDLADAQIEELQVRLRPVGLWRRRASSLKALAVEVSRRDGRFPKGRVEIEKLPGVGQYIASAIIVFCDESAEPLLDVNMARVLERYFGPRKLADIRYDPYLQKLSKRLVSKANPAEVNWAVLDLAALVCKTGIPLCKSCPVMAGCRFARETQ
jgi:A/G-specific adenine glycosylase